MKKFKNEKCWKNKRKIINFQHGCLVHKMENIYIYIYFICLVNKKNNMMKNSWLKFTIIHLLYKNFVFPFLFFKEQLVI